MGPQGAHKNDLKSRTFQGPPSDPKMEPKWSQNGAKMEPKWIQNGTKMDPKWSQNERKSNPKECKTKPKLMPSPSSPSPSPPQTRKTSSNVAKDLSCRGTPRKSREAVGNRRTRQKDARSHETANGNTRHIKTALPVSCQSGYPETLSFPCFFRLVF